jgi:hypothetical protein
MNNFNRNTNKNIITIVIFVLDIFRNFGLTIFTFIWIFVSAGSLRSVCPQIDTFLPSISNIIENKIKPFHLVSSYGLFRRMTGVYEINESETKLFNNVLYGGLHPSIVARPELVIEGFDATTNEWLEIHFMYKPTDIKQSPVFIAPHQPRLDWQMWFAALGSYNSNPWLLHIMYRLLRNDSHDIIELLDKEKYPFKINPPVRLRAILYDYDFTRFNSTWVNIKPYTEILSTSNNNLNHWWSRRNRRDYTPELEDKNPSLIAFLNAHGINTSRSYISRNQQIQSCLSLGNNVNNYTILNKLRNRICHSLQFFEYKDKILSTIVIILISSILSEIINMRKN